MHHDIRWFGLVILTTNLLWAIGCNPRTPASNSQSRLASTSARKDMISPLIFHPKEKIGAVVKRSFQGNAKSTILVDCFAGDIVFEPGDGTAVEVEISKEGWGQSKEEALLCLKQINLDIKQQAETIRINTPMPEPAGHWFGKTDVRIKGPAQAVLDLKTKNGQIAVSGATNRLKASSGYRNIDVKQNSAAFDLTCERGSITVEGPGSGQANTIEGNIDVDGCLQPVMLTTTRNGDIKVAHASAVTATTKNGSIAISASRGPFQLKSEIWGSISIKDGNGLTKAETSAGDINITGTKGDYTVKSAYSPVNLDVVDSSVQAETTGGSPIKIKACRSPKASPS
jgi:hypothetical protein